MSSINFRGGFSDRSGISPISTEIQITTINARTRISLYNYLKHFYKKCVYDYPKFTNTQGFCYYLLSNVFVELIDDDYIHEDIVWTMIKNSIISGTYDEVLTIIEAVAIGLNAYKKYESRNRKIFNELNDLFKREFLGYRFIDCKINRISDEDEVTAINDALFNSENIVVDHLRKSLNFLSDRINPDYENSIKESITAVEAKCSIVTEATGKHSTLGNTLKHLKDSGIEIHGSLELGFEKLYGYTNDGKGLRHAGDIGGPDATFKEAKFMLVACCAFVNYLTEAQSEIESE